jgi:photosystem II stability/assembly factor-like uncharacterized protein
LKFAQNEGYEAMKNEQRQDPRKPRPAKALLQDEFSEAELDRDNSRLAGKGRTPIATLRIGAIEHRRDLARRSAPKGGNSNDWRDGDVVSGVPNWVELGPRAVPNGQTYSASRVIVSGRVAGIAVHPTTPTTIYVAGARGGIWKTIDGGATWSAKSDNEISLAMGAIALAPSAPDTIYAGTGEGHIYYLTAFNPFNALNESYQGSGILKSIDGGTSWTRQAAAALTGAACYRIVVHPTNPLVAFAATSRGLYRTLDGGTTWSQLAGLPAISGSVIACTDVAMDPTNGDRVWTAFWGSGIYETSNATAAGGPTWTLVAGNPSSPGRIALAVSPSSPATVYALEATAGGSYKGLYQTTGGVGGTWAAITYTGATPNVSTSRCCMGVDVTTPDVVYLCGVSLHKVVRNAATNTWAATDIGLNIHPDNRTFAAHPTDPLTFYAGTDGGIYASSDGGTTWSDSINKRLNLMQFEFIDQHPAYDAIVFGGTQDNGTDQFRTSEVFYHAADGDGGAVAVDQSDPRNVVIEHYSISPERSITAGKFGTFSGIGGIAGASLFYPLFDLDRTNQQNIAFGTDRLSLDAAQGTGGWPTQIALPGVTGLVSAVAYVSSTLLYAATTAGEVYRAVFAAGSWTATAVHAAPLPTGWIWDIAVPSSNPSQLTIGFGGFGISHVWRGVVNAAGTSAAWTDVSGVAPQTLPDAPVNSLALDPLHPATIYAGTDIGVFATTNDGAAWSSFREGLPNTAIYDLKLHGAARLLRAATHGRGIWERELDAATSTDAVICLRDNVMHSGRGVAPSGVPSALEDTLQHVALGDPVYWWQCADAKIDALAGSPPTYQFPVSGVDFVAYEALLSHRDPERGRVNNVYITVHNRGISTGTVTVKLLFADATMSLPDVPADFWTAFPADPAPGSPWTPIGAAQTLTVEPGLPTVFYWPWTTPTTAAQHSCLLIVTDAPEDPIPAANKVLNIGALVTSERHVGLKNLHVVDPTAANGPGDVLLLPFTLNARRGDTVRIMRTRLPGWKMSLVVPQAVKLEAVSEPLLARKVSRPLTRALADQVEVAAKRAPNPMQHFGFTRPAAAIRLPQAIAARVYIAIERGVRARGGTVTLIQEREGKVLGGNTFVVPSQESKKPSERRTG